MPGGRIMLFIFSILAAIIALAFIVLLVYSPGKPVPFKDADGSPLAGSISEKVHLQVNGVEQGMFIKSKDSANPVLLYLHGGMPDYFLTGKYPTGLEDIFTVVWWEQRGSGMSYSADIPKETMTLEQMIADAKAVTDYLRERFKCDKIYLMGHSGGTFIGIHVAARYPELYYAYLGIAQMSYQLGSEIRAHEFMLAKYDEQGNHKMVRKLEAAPVNTKDGVSREYTLLRDGAMHELGVGTTHDMKSVISGIFLPSLLCKEYTLMEKINMWRGKSRSGISVMWDTMVATDLSQKITEVDIPVYFFHGVHDYTVSYKLAKEYFEKLNAPSKKFYSFENSAHSPIFEEPEKVREIIVGEILKREATANTN